MTTITREQVLKIIEAAEEVISALAGTNEDVHPGSDNMLRLWDDLNDRYAPPEVVRELARIVLASLEAEPMAFVSKERRMEIKSEDELSNIVLFPVKEDDPRNQVNFLYEPSERPYCHHASVRVDEKERQVRCKICGAVVEPFDWMLSVAKRETRLADDVKLLRQEEQERRKNIEKLIQIERNAKARIRRVTKSRTE